MMRIAAGDSRSVSNATSGDRKHIVTAVCFAVPLLTIFAALNGYEVSAQNAEQFPDAYGRSRTELRLAPLNARFPATAQFGYITDLDPSNQVYSAALLATQYALAPRQLFIVGKKAVPEWAVGIFTRPGDYASAGAAHGYEMAADMGNGVVLYHRKDSR